MKEESVLGFIFDPTLQKVLLIKKNRPEWQRGKYNGIGGKVESGEIAIEAMTRETVEETGLQVSNESWVLVAMSSSNDWDLTMYAAVYTDAMQDAKTVTDEAVEWVPIHDLPETVISNLTWKIPLCLDKLRTNTPKKVVITY